MNYFICLMMDGLTNYKFIFFLFISTGLQKVLQNTRELGYSDLSDRGYKKYVHVNAFSDPSSFN